MEDFNEINLASKNEQIRAWSVSQAVEIHTRTGAIGFGTSDIVESARKIEKFVLTGKTE